MNHSKFEFRNKDLRSRTNKVGQAFQPAPRNLPCWLPSSAEEAGAGTGRQSHASAGVVRLDWVETFSRVLRVTNLHFQHDTLE